MPSSNCADAAQDQDEPADQPEQEEARPERLRGLSPYRRPMKLSVSHNRTNVASPRDRLAATQKIIHPTSSSPFLAVSIATHSNLKLRHNASAAGRCARPSRTDAPGARSQSPKLWSGHAAIRTFFWSLNSL